MVRHGVLPSHPAVTNSTHVFTPRRVARFSHSSRWLTGVLTVLRDLAVGLALLHHLRHHPLLWGNWARSRAATAWRSAIWRNPTALTVRVGSGSGRGAPVSRAVPLAHTCAAQA